MATDPYGGWTPSTSTSTATAPPPVTSAPVDPYNGWKPKNKVQHDPQWLGRVEAVSKYFADSPVAQGLNAIVGAPDNAIVGGELAAANKGNFGDIARGAWEGMTNPGQAANNVHALEQKWHLPVAGKNANFAQRAGQVLEDTTIQSQSLAIPGLDVLTGVRLGGKLLSKVPGLSLAATKMATSTPVDRLVGFFDADHGIKKFVNEKGLGEAKAALAWKTPGMAGKTIHNTPDQVAYAVDIAGGLKPGVTHADFKTYLESVKGAQYAEAMLKKHNVDSNVLQWISSYQKDALFVLPFAHMKNLTVLAGLGPGGMGTIKNGIGFAKKLAQNDPATLAELKKYQKIGAASDYYGAGGASKFANVPIAGKMSDWSNKVLTDYDNGLRLAVAKKLESRGMGTVEIGAQLRDIMGDYLHPSDMTKVLRNIGGNFPAWRTQIVPKAMFKAAKEQPRAMKLYARTNANIANDITEPMVGSSFDLGGPAEDASKAADFPVGTGEFATSGSTIGPIADAFALKDAQQKGKVGQWAAGEAERFVPFGSVLSKLPGLDPWQDKAPWPVNVGLGLFGAYLPNTQTIKAERSSFRRKGLKDKSIVDQMKFEGHFKGDPYGN